MFIYTLLLLLNVILIVIACKPVSRQRKDLSHEGYFVKQSPYNVDPANYHEIRSLPRETDPQIEALTNGTKVTS